MSNLRFEAVSEASKRKPVELLASDQVNSSERRYSTDRRCTSISLQMSMRNW